MSEIPDWLAKLNAAVDRMDPDGILARMTEDAGFGFSGHIQARGHSEIRALLDGFYSRIDGLEHKIAEVITLADSTLSLGEVTYEVGGEQVSTGFVVRYRLDDAKRVKDYIIYVDTLPLVRLQERHGR